MDICTCGHLLTFHKDDTAKRPCQVERCVCVGYKKKKNRLLDFFDKYLRWL